MPKDALSQQDIDTLGYLLNERDDRTAFYLHYYELTGNERVLEMAKISQLTDYEGAVAGRANEVIQQQFPDQYPAGGVFSFSKEIAPSVFAAVTKDFYEGTGTGVIDGRAALEAARAPWDAHGLGEQFPGNPMLALERAADWDAKGAWAAFDSQGTEIAVGSAAYVAVPDISGQPQPGQAHFENAAYHLTPDEKVGFYTDRETGRFLGVFDRPTDLSTEPPIESRGVLNAVPEPPPPPAPLLTDFNLSLSPPPPADDRADGWSDNHSILAGAGWYALGYTAALQPEGPVAAVTPPPAEPAGSVLSDLRESLYVPPDPAPPPAPDPVGYVGTTWADAPPPSPDYTFAGPDPVQPAEPVSRPNFTAPEPPPPTESTWFSGGWPSATDNSPPESAAAPFTESYHQETTAPAYESHSPSDSFSSGTVDSGGSSSSSSSPSGDGGGGGDS